MEGDGDEELIHDPHLSSVDSLEETITDDPPPPDSGELPLPPITDTAVLTDELRDKIIKQVSHLIS